LVSLPMSPSFSSDIPTVLEANANSCSLSTESPVLLLAISNSFANSPASLTATPTAAATARVATLAALAAFVKLLNDLSVFFTLVSSLFSFSSVDFRDESSFAVLASSSTISFSVAINHPYRAMLG